MTQHDVCVQIQSFNGSYAYTGITLDQRDNYIQWKHKVNDSHAITGQEIHATFTTNPNNFATNTIQIITKTPNQPLKEMTDSIRMHTIMRNTDLAIFIAWEDSNI